MMDRTERLAQLLEDAILLAESSSQQRLLRHLRGARLSLNNAIGKGVRIRVDLLSARVFAGGIGVPLAPAELAIVVLLSIKRRAIPRDALAVDLFPDSDRSSAANSVKVNVHRARRRIGFSDAIRCESGRYMLGDSVDVDLPCLEAALRRFQIAEILSCEDCDWLEELRQRIFDGRPAFMLDWAWFDDTEQHLRVLGHDVTVLLARDALRKEHYDRAIELAVEIAREDPLDEEAAEIAIKAPLLAGNRAAAVLEYRRYASVLRREIDCQPSDGLRALVNF